MKGGRSVPLWRRSNYPFDRVISLVTTLLVVTTCLRRWKGSLLQILDGKAASGASNKVAPHSGISAVCRGEYTSVIHVIIIEAIALPCLIRLDSVRFSQGVPPSSSSLSRSSW